MLKLDQITYMYPTESVAVLKNMSLHVQKGGVVLLTGDNGSGKTTLLKVVAGIVPKFTGGTFLGSRNYNGHDFHEIQTSMGFVFSMRENPFIHARVDQEILHLLETHLTDGNQVQLKFEKIVSDFFLQPILHKETRSLSSGETQLLNLALGFLFDPKLILMDEPLLYLDVELKQKIIDRLREIHQRDQKTFIIADHMPTNWTTFPDLQQINLESPPEEHTQEKQFHMNPSATFGETLMELNGVSFSHDKTPLLKDIHQKIHVGQCVGLLGPVGSGKTTLLKIIQGVYRPTNGNIKFRNDKIKTRMLTTPTIDNFFSLKVAQELKLGNSRAIRESIFPIQDFLPKFVFDLSQGEQKKIALELAFQDTTDLLLLDEPFVNLDKHSKSILLQKIYEYKRAGGTIIITSHELDPLQSLLDQKWKL
jgi:energy-coupling factor transporter ATP-binding protein EcfA2